MKEDKDKISAYAIPGVAKIHVFKNNTHDHLRQRDKFVSIDVKNKAIRFSKAAVLDMNLKPGERLAFLTLGDMLCCCLAVDGNKLVRATRGDMVIKNSIFINYVKQNMGAYTSFRCGIKRTKNYFNGETVYELVPPHRYKKTFAIKHRNEITMHSTVGVK